MLLSIPLALSNNLLLPLFTELFFVQFRLCSEFTFMFLYLVQLSEFCDCYVGVSSISFFVIFIAMFQN